MVSAISLVLCVVVLVVTTSPPEIDSAPPPIKFVPGNFGQIKFARTSWRETLVKLNSPEVEV
jgi:hypothetical protein